jgi:UDP-3-O-acyl-N-acetylglucosamine deacetylase
VVALRAGHALHTRLVKAILETSPVAETVGAAVTSEIPAPVLARSAR